MIINKSISYRTKNPFIVIEGIDGSGKSSVSNAVAKKLNYSHYEYPKAHKNVVSVFDTDVSTLSRFLFYLSYNAQVSTDVKLLTEIKPTICVRYIYSSIVYHLVKGVDKNIILNLVSNIPLLIPDKIIYLDVSDKEQQLSRIKKRGMLEEDKRVLKVMDNIRRNYFDILEDVPNVEYIDTSNLTFEEVENKILNYL